MARTVDQISEGRLILGIGAGWFERDYDEYGYEFGTAGSRITDLGEALPRIESRWTKLNPAPTRDIPVLIGGGGERKTLKLVARHATIWHGFGSPETLAHKNEVLDEWCAQVGRDPGEIERTTATDRPPSAIGRELYDLGFRMITLSADGRTGYDLSLVREWIAFRDEVNG
jgi:alkanesulfonate monooxygenase SsuD/methylene tetrahydromethanopterin reductase-like flavin-dependent oxidoreductase (luciferase family)